MANTEKIVVQVVVQGEKDLKRLEKRAGTTTKSFAKMAAGIAGAVAAFRAVSSAVGSAINTFKGFEFQMAKVRATTGASDKDFKKLNASAQQLGRTTFFTASQVGALQMNFAKLGFTTSEILDAQEATLRLATATGSDLARAAVVAGAAVRGFNLDASETERVVDVMAVAFTSSALDIEKFQTSMTKVAPIAAGAGISIESTTAVMGKLTDAGIEASIAGTSLRNIFLKMQDSSSDLAQHLGFTVKSSADLEKALKQLNSEGLSNEEIMQLVDIRQVAAFATMVNGTDAILNMTDALHDANGAAQEMADIMANTLEGDLITAKSAWEGFTIAIMEGSGNISKFLRNVVQTFTFTLNEFSDSFKDSDQIAADMFTNATETAKQETKKLIKDRGEFGTTYSRQLHEEMHLLKQTLRRKEADVKESEDKLVELTGDGSKARMFFYNQEITEEEKRLTERKNIFEATKKTIEDLAEEVEVQKKKEASALEIADLKQFQKEQQALRDKEKAEAKKKRKEEKDRKEALEREKEYFKESQNAFKIALQQELNDDKQNLIDGLITEEEFNNRKFEAEQAHLENMKNLNIAYGEDVTAINSQILDNYLKMIGDRAAAEAKAAQQKLQDDAKEKKERTDKIQEMEDIGNQLIFIAGEEENLNAVKKAGIAISQAAALAKSFEAMAEYGKAISSAAAESPWWMKIINVVGLISAMASTLSLIKSIKSSFGDGGVIEEYANGGMVHGKSHAQGGEKFAVGGRVVELEGGEAVINKRSTAMFRNQLSAMNAAGGGVKFADGGMINQPSFSQQEFNVLGQNQMMGAMGGASKVVVVESDITSVQREVSVVESDAKI
mgnify:CR=1 FL=1|jgi:TP901 family phage tail tape measure protein